MINMLREILLALARLPILAWLLIGAAIAAEFVVITQWEQLNFRQWSQLNFEQPSTPPPAETTVALELPEQRSFDFPEIPAPDKAKVAAVETAVAKRMARIVIIEPKVEANGTIINDGQTLYLYGIKPFDSKKLCTRASGERWACGLHAYATFRNTIAKKQLVCDPKKIIQNGVAAV